MMFEVHQCTHPACHLRMPIDPAIHRGAFCPRCGAPMVRVAGSYDHRQSSGEGSPKRKISLLLDNIRSAYNTGAIFRTADGVGAEHVYLCGFTPSPEDSPAVQKTALGAEIQLPWSAHPDGCVLSQSLREEGFSLLVLETTELSVPIFEVDPQSIGSAPIVLVVGNEQAGVDPGIIDLCDLVLSIPMIGSKASLNVAVALGVASYWLTFI
jgi:tRNA G18 (ribose-2'-O)-methylase SpoU